MHRRIIEEVGKSTILWGYNFQTDGVIQHCRSDIIVLDKGTKNCHVIDVAITTNTNIANDLIERITNYSDLKVKTDFLQSGKEMSR